VCEQTIGVQNIWFRGACDDVEALKLTLPSNAQVTSKFRLPLRVLGGGSEYAGM